MQASEAGKMECVKVLLLGGVQVNVQNKVSAVLIKLQVMKEYALKLYNRCAKGSITTCIS